MIHCCVTSHPEPSDSVLTISESGIPGNSTLPLWVSSDNDSPGVSWLSAVSFFLRRPPGGRQQSPTQHALPPVPGPCVSPRRGNHVWIFREDLSNWI